MKIRTFACAALALGCSGSINPQAPVDAGAGADAHDSSTLSSVRVIVVDFPGIGPNTMRSPLAGATVSMVKPDGSYEEKSSDANGMVVFDGIDWSQGTASFTAVSPGHGAYGITNLSPATFAAMEIGPYASQADVLLYAFPLATTLPVAVTAQLTRSNVVDRVAVGGTNTTAFVDSPGDTAGLTATPNAPFSLVAFEYKPDVGASPQDGLLVPVRFARFDEPAAQGTTDNVALDMVAGGTTLTPTTVHGTVNIPGGKGGPLGSAVLFENVTSFESNGGLFLGTRISSVLAADGSSFASTTEFVDVAGQTPQTSYVLALANQSGSLRTTFAAPKDGETIDGFLAPPTVPKSYSLASSLPITAAAQKTVSRLVVFDKTNALLFLLDAPPGTPSIAVPQMPSSATALLKPPMSGALYSLADLEPVHLYWTRLGYSKPLSITP